MTERIEKGEDRKIEEEVLQKYRESGVWIEGDAKKADHRKSSIKVLKSFMNKRDLIFQRSKN